MTGSHQEALSLITERLTAVFDVGRIVLFGSRCRGEAQPDSDLDVLVVVSSTVPFVQRQAIARRAVGRLGVPLDLLVFTHEEAKRAAAIPGTAVYWAEREGIEVYAQ